MLVVLRESHLSNKILCMLSLRLESLVCYRLPRLSLARTYSATSYRFTERRKMAVQQPEWRLPAQKADEPVLKVYNSLTRTKVHACVDLISYMLSDHPSRLNLYPLMDVM